MDFQYIVVGAGFAGSVIAERISNILNKKVLLIEQKNHVGGHCYDYIDKNGIIIHKYGPHLFHTNYDNVYDYLSNFTEWDLYNHKVLAFIDGQKVPIPFNLNTLHKIFPKTLADKLEKKLIDKYTYNSKIPILELMKEKDKDLLFLANFIYEKVFKNYTIKQWEIKPENIDPNVTARVPIFIGKDDRYFNDKYQCVPKYGYSKIFNNMLNNKNIKILLNTSFNEIIDIDYNKHDIYLFKNKFKGKLIFTGMVDELFQFKFGYLPYRSLNLKFETINKELYQETATVNYPNNYKFTRITEFKHIHPVKTEKTTILKEYPQKFEFGKNNPYYPIFTDENNKKYNKYLEYSKKFENLILLGRLAEYKYYNMDQIINQALITFESLR